jgi:hypothetical protein
MQQITQKHTVLPERRRVALGWVLCASWLGAFGAGCGGHACPSSSSPGDVARWAAELRAREPLRLDYGAGISVKRDMQEVVVDVEASQLAAAFQAVMSDPARRFGLIRVDRLPEDANRPFRAGDKFQGRYQLEAAAQAELRGHLQKWFGDLAQSDDVERLLCAIENQHTSDFGQIRTLEMSPAPGKPYVLEYVYLAGSPIAGSSTFWISDVGDADLLARHGVTRAALLRQVFEYQEQSGSFASFFTRGGLRLHDQVVFSQAQQSAAAAGGRILETTIPAEYRGW